MPLYEYACDACGQRFEVIQKYSDPTPEACRKCGSGPVHRQQSSPAFQFKGSGWYVTDYAGKSKAKGGDGSAADNVPSQASEKSSDKGGENGGAQKSGDAPAGSPVPSTPAPAATPVKD